VGLSGNGQTRGGLSTRQGAEWPPAERLEGDDGLGSGVQEIRIRDASGAFRIVYVARFAEAVYVLHCFQKKSQKTARLNLELVVSRYGELMRERKQ
jgi:phage-related protein